MVINFIYLINVYTLAFLYVPFVCLYWIKKEIEKYPTKADCLTESLMCMCISQTEHIKVIMCINGWKKRSKFYLLSDLFLFVCLEIKHSNRKKGNVKCKIVILFQPNKKRR